MWEIYKSGSVRDVELPKGIYTMSTRQKLLPDNFKVNGIKFSLIKRQKNLLLYVCRKKGEIQGFEIVKSVFIGPDGLPASNDRNAVETLPPMPIKDVNRWQIATRSEAVKKFNELWMDASRQARLARRIVYSNVEANKQKLPGKTTFKSKSDPLIPLLFPENNPVAEQISDLYGENDAIKENTAEMNWTLKNRFLGK
jgi:hypothetical protein